jgi:hypothetical protein
MGGAPGEATQAQNTKHVKQPKPTFFDKTACRKLKWSWKGAALLSQKRHISPDRFLSQHEVAVPQLHEHTEHCGDVHTADDHSNTLVTQRNLQQQNCT